MLLSLNTLNFVPINIALFSDIIVRRHSALRFSMPVYSAFPNLGLAASGFILSLRYLISYFTVNVYFSIFTKSFSFFLAICTLGKIA